ncbi:MAG: AAA family ATPase [Candidatus Omnitrophica bacterium]|nr:AAA family ATPase [Candidatus Omnitrophota bacterium]
MRARKFKLFLKFHWIKILIALGILGILISLAIFMRNAINAWVLTESYSKRQMFAQYSMLFYVFVVTQLISMPVYALFWYWLMFRGGHFKMTSMLKKGIKGKDVNIYWDDVIGMEEAKQEASEVVRLVKDRAELQRIGGKILRGILMIGPPGCGKTYLAKAIATEANLPFISMSGSEFVEMFVGVGSSRIRKLFKQARQLAYSEGGCIVFIDELDAVGARRSTDKGFGGQTEFNTTLNQLLVEMDGLKEKDDNIVIMGATNAPESFLDPALLRPGRFDRKIFVDVPNLEEREKLFAYYLKEVKYDPSLEIPRLARMAVGHTPADIANLVREAALIAVRNRKEIISLKEITEALDRVEMGIKHKRVFSEEERKKVAYHEAGHAIAMYLLHPSEDVFKASIASRGEALGMVVSHPREEMHIRTKEEILGAIKYCLGSYAAESLTFGTTTTGVSQDFRQAMSHAHQMVWNFGMGKSGLVGDYSILESGLYQSKGFRSSENASFISEKVKEQLNQETQDILQDCLKEVKELLRKESKLLGRFAQELLTKEELNYDEIDDIFHEYGFKRPPKQA